MGSYMDGVPKAWSQLVSNSNCTPSPEVFWNPLTVCNELAFGELEYNSKQQNRFSKPMVWIGIYIVLASLFCILPMVADLLHGLRNRELLFPCKYFTLNAAFLSVIAVAIKLPMDLNNPMPGIVDQSAKIGSMAFMCTMMASLLPSLSTMDNKQLLTNIIALGVLVITLVVNVCIQITTGVVSLEGFDSWAHFAGGDTYFGAGNLYKIIAIIYVAMLLMLLIIYTCSSLAIIKYKQILESQYQVGHQTKDQLLQQTGRLTIEKLRQHVRNHWIMAATGSPQFMTAYFATTAASGVICAITSALQILIMLVVCLHMKQYRSDYKWSTEMILITQFSGVVLGSIAPICRCFALLSFKLSIKCIWDHIKVFKVESYWTEKLCDWKQSSVQFTFRNRKCKVVIQKLKNLILSFCIGLQKVVVVACKIIGLVPIFLVILVLYCSHCWKRLKTVFSDVQGNRPEQNEVLSPYVLQLQANMNLAERTLKGISKSLLFLIQRAEKQQPTYLTKLLEKSRGFEGVGKYNSHLVPPLLSQEFLDCWSLPLVTLTTIAISLPNIQHHIVDSLLSGVSEGLVYVTLVEESFNATTDDYVSIQKAAKTLWLEVEVYHKWLGNKLQNPAPQMNTVEQILQWFRDMAKNIVTEVESMDIGGRNDHSLHRSISANSMYRITETILLSYQANIEEVSQEELFEKLSSMISDILAACLTNLPRVIAIKCHTSVIEEREESVHAAVQLLGETTQIINSLEDCELPNLNPNDLGFIGKWCAYFQHPFP